MSSEPNTEPKSNRHVTSTTPPPQQNTSTVTDRYINVEDSPEGDKFCAFMAFRKHIDSALDPSSSRVTPHLLVDNLDKFLSSYVQFSQHDAHEFMILALDKIGKCIEENIFHQIFGGVLLSKVCCSNCGHFSEPRLEAVLDISLEVRDKNVTSIETALQSFTKVENVEYKCENCKQTHLAEKQLKLCKAPSIAMIHLKRFVTDLHGPKKISGPLDFPVELDLQPFTDADQNHNEPNKYDLYAVIVHRGDSVNSGHYFCYIRTKTNQWHYMSDSEVHEVERSIVLSSQAYMVFYTKQGWFPKNSQPVVLEATPSQVATYRIWKSKQNDTSKALQLSLKGCGKQDDERILMRAYVNSPVFAAAKAAAEAEDTCKPPRGKIPICRRSVKKKGKKKGKKKIKTNFDSYVKEAINWDDDQTFSRDEPNVSSSDEP